jgi:hypothetical protein
MTRPTEDTVCTVIMLTLGAVAATGSYSHIRETAAAHGQGGWIAYAIAATVDLLALGSGLEIRRRRRLAAGVIWPWCTLILGVAMTLGANLATAEQSFWGVAMAAWPALAFLAAVLLIETRGHGDARRRVGVAVGVAVEGVGVATPAFSPASAPGVPTLPDVPTPPGVAEVATPRPPVATPDPAVAIAAARVADPGLSQNGVATLTGVPRSTVRRYWDQTAPGPHLTAVREDTP